MYNVFLLEVTEDSPVWPERLEGWSCCKMGVGWGRLWKEQVEG